MAAVDAGPSYLLREEGDGKEWFMSFWYCSLFAQDSHIKAIDIFNDFFLSLSLPAVEYLMQNLDLWIHSTWKLNLGKCCARSLSTPIVAKSGITFA